MSTHPRMGTSAEEVNNPTKAQLGEPRVLLARDCLQGHGCVGSFYFNSTQDRIIWKNANLTEKMTSTSLAVGKVCDPFS